MSARTPHPSHDSVFMRACRREPVPFTPVWLMRQAGRYMPEYREVRAKTTLLELCKSPDLVSEVTVTAARRLGVDAAILFADLLLVVEALGLRLEFTQGEGPVISPPVRDGRAVDALREVDPDDLAYVYDAVRATRRDLEPGLPLIGFAGAPFTVASYLIEGGGSRHYVHTKRLMYGDEGAWNALMKKLVRAQTSYLNRQIAAGCQAVQLFDSWVGALAPADYRRYVKPHVRSLVAGLEPGVPILHFGTGTATLLADMRDAGGTVIGVDWRVDLDRAWAEIGPDRAIMGNLDPLVLFAEPAVLVRETCRILDQAAGRPGHVFNLGHGILPETPVDHVIRLVDTVHAPPGRAAGRATAGSGSSSAGPPIDSVLLVGFGGPTAPEEIMPFLRNVVFGRGIPDERLREVEHHYHEVGGSSPYNEQTFAQRDRLARWLSEHGHGLPVYVGMRNWDPLLKDTIAAMNRDGRRHAVGVILAGFRSEVSWERYKGDVACAIAGNAGTGPRVTWLDAWFAEPRFHEANAQELERATGFRRGAWPRDVPIVFTAHSIPTAMADASPYVSDLRLACAGVARILGVADWELAWQSRSGDPRTPWLEPDINDVLRRRAADGTRALVVQAIGFLSDHVEVLFDLDIEARQTAREAGIALTRAACVHDHPEFIAMLGERIAERVGRHAAGYAAGRGVGGVRTPGA